MSTKFYILKSLAKIDNFLLMNSICNFLYSPQPDLRYTNIFPTTLYVCGSPFLHPWARRDTSRVSALSGRRNLEVVVIVVIIAPPQWSPPYDFQKSSKFIKIYKGKCNRSLLHPSQPDLRYTNIFPTTLYVCGSPFLHPWAQRHTDRKFRIFSSERQHNSGSCYCCYCYCYCCE